MHAFLIVIKPFATLVVLETGVTWELAQHLCIRLPDLDDVLEVLQQKGAHVRLVSDIAERLGSDNAEGLGSNMAERLGSDIAEGLMSDMAEGLGSDIAEGLRSDMAEGLESDIAEGLRSDMAEGLG
ncbi:hypothetical protein DPMN_095887 [Dreissena polymorpha]|uniref:Uncharacterized protein n=1 Tax=Dreissena polymorpha TaxID=45954 RepID=A0A9D4R4Y4_DREPO|nr:hypothetical protein DPMN_095887 [Dreissena polymorpha]